jgi:hypothetical protein
MPTLATVLWLVAVFFGVDGVTFSVYLLLTIRRLGIQGFRRLVFRVFKVDFDLQQALALEEG